MLLDDKDCTGWVEHDNSAGISGDASAEKAGEANHTHYVTFIHASMKYSMSPAAGTAKLYDNAGVVAQFNIMGCQQYGGNDGLTISFPRPIRITAGAAVKLTVTPDSTSNNTAMDAVIMGFTLRD